jgi:hypothetical protein
MKVGYGQSMIFPDDPDLREFAGAIIGGRCKNGELLSSSNRGPFPVEEIDYVIVASSTEGSAYEQVVKIEAAFLLPDE